mgnify:CR=1 FL=1
MIKSKHIKKKIFIFPNRLRIKTMNKKNSKYIIGLTLIEILIGIAITTIMMAAMYTSYNVVNKSYSKVSEKAKISKSSRDLVSMLMRDIRMAGFKYYAGIYEIEKFSDEKNLELL